jgi:exopolysaccharide transport family protein
MEKIGMERHAALTAYDGFAAASAQQGGLGDLLKLSLDFVRRRYVLIFLGIALALGLGLGYLKVAPPTYKATTKMLVENQQVQFVQQQSYISQGSVDLAHLENQIEILKSKPVAVNVIRKLNLANSREFDRTISGVLPQIYRLVWAYVGWPANASPSTAADSDQDLSDDLVAAFESRLDCVRVGMSNVIEIAYNASNPYLAAKIANAVAAAYLTERLDAKAKASHVEVAWLQKRLSELGEQAIDSERKVNHYRTMNNIVTVAGNSIGEQRISDLNKQLVEARTRMAEAGARMQRYQSITSSDPEHLASDAPIGDALTSPIINDLRQKYLEYARRSAEWTARFGPRHLAVVSLRRKMRDIRTSIADELHRLAEASKNDYMVSQQQVKSIEAELAKAVSDSRNMNSTEAKMREMEVNAKSYRGLYDSFLQQYMRTIQQQSFPIAEARVISAAAPPQSKSKPKSALIIAFSLAAGGVLGAGFGFLRDLTDGVFRTSNQVESKLDTKCLSIVPMFEERRTRRRRGSGKDDKDASAHKRLIVHGSDRFWAATQKPLSHFAESIRFINLAVDQALSFTSSKVVGVTSTLPNEGKTTIAAATSALTAQRGKRVIVVDCDLRNPSLSRRLTPEARCGLVDVISGRCPLSEAVWHDSKTNLAFLPLVTEPASLCTGDILLSEGTEALFEELRRKYDYVIVDLPPVNPVVDVRTTTPWIDGFLLVVEWGRTKIDMVQHALHLAPDVREALIGAVLNKTDMRAIRRYDARHSYPNTYQEAA